MQIEIYVDILFFINFIMIFFIYWCVNKLNKHKVKLSRLALTSIITSFSYCIVIIFFRYSVILNYFFNFLIVISSVSLCFRPNNIKILAILLLKVMLVSLFIVGLCIYLYLFKLNPLILVSKNLNFSLKNFPFKILFFSIIISYIFIKLFFNWYKKIVIKGQTFYNIKVYKNKKSVNLKCLLDTGNSLKDPLTNKPIIIAEFNAIKNILPTEVKNIFYNNVFDLNKEPIPIGIRLIPFKSIGKKEGILIGINVDKIEIEYKNNLTNVVIGICNFNLCKDGFYNALLGPELINN